MAEHARKRSDRRSGKDRRVVHDLSYFLKGGTERRRFVERRWRAEMRTGWARVSKWRSAKVKGNSEPPS